MHSHKDFCCSVKAIMVRSSSLHGYNKKSTWVRLVGDHCANIPATVTCRIYHSIKHKKTAMRLCCFIPSSILYLELSSPE